MRFGIDHLLKLNPEWKNKRIGLLTNDGATTCGGNLSRLELIRSRFNISKLFSPEHGIYASHPDGKKVKNSRDVITSLPICSLYNDKIGVPQVDLKNLDIVLIDLPDVGVRCYTYLWSSFDLMKACAKEKIPLIVLDRPNPLGGIVEHAEGPNMSQKCKSFIGKCNIPLTHYCSLGELLNYLNTSEKINADIDVIKCSWKRNQHFNAWGISWVRPSPGLKSYNACLLYPMLCFFEATNMTLARNEKFSFEFIGAEWLNKSNDKIINSDLVHFEKKCFTYNGNTIFGYSLSASMPLQNPIYIGLSLLYYFKKTYPKNFQWNSYATQANPTGSKHLDLLTGISNSYKLFNLEEDSFDMVLQQALLVDWKKEIEPFLFYK